MSRTFRRTGKDGVYLKSYYVYPVNKIKVIDGQLHTYWYSSADFILEIPAYRNLSVDKFCKVKSAWFHSDFNAGHWNAPKRFRQTENRKLRYRSNRELQKKLEDFIDPLYVKNANWNY